MDFFGIGPALQGVARAYFCGARQTRRTTRLVDSLRDGDRVVFANENHAEHARRLCRERGVNVHCVVIDPNNLHCIFGIARSNGKTMFDHAWLEAYYLLALKRAESDIAIVEAKSSGDGSIRGFREYTSSIESAIPTWRK